MLVSAYWHGIHLGLYMGLLSTTPCILAENVMEIGVRRRIPANSRLHRVYDICSWMFCTRMMDYMSVGFLLKYVNHTWRYWKSVYFIGHAVTLALYVVGIIAIEVQRKGKRRQIANKNHDVDVGLKVSEE